MPDRVMFVRTTERKNFTACRQQWWWTFVDRLSSKDTKPALRFGDLVHQALAIYYPPGEKRGPHPAGTFGKLFDEQIEAGMHDFAIYDEEERVDARTLGVDMLEHYVERWGGDERIRVIAPEMAFQVPLKDKNGKPLRVKLEDGKMHLVVYAGSGDCVIEDMETGQIGLWEHKTAASIGLTHLPLDEQAGSYWVFVPEWLRMQGILEPDQDLDFIWYNFLRKAMRDTRPVNDYGQRLNNPKKADLTPLLDAKGIAYKKSAKLDELMELVRGTGTDPETLGEVSKSQPPEHFVRQKVYRNDIDRMNIMYRIRAQVWEMAQVRNGKLPLYKNPAGTWPDQHCNGCQFRDMCELHETGADWEELRDFTMTTWAPYADHESDVYVSTPWAGEQ